jgi:hypothetical protein
MFKKYGNNIFHIKNKIKTIMVTHGQKSAFFQYLFYYFHFWTFINVQNRFWRWNYTQNSAL